jgi:multidrug resistance protein, MATE family
MLTLALPLVAVQLGQAAMQVVDNIMVGHVSGDAMAAVALGSIYSFGLLMFGMGVLLALDPLVSQAVGAGDTEGAARAVQRGVVLAVLMAIVLAALHLPAAAVFRLLGQRETIVPTAAAFVRASIPGLAPVLFVTVMRQSLQARHHVRPIVVAMLIANFVNAGLNWVLVYGNLGAPAMGAVGSGWATSASRWFLALCLAATAWPELRPHLVPWRRGVLDLAPLGRIVALGLPIGFQILLEVAAFNGAGLILGARGAAALAGHQVALSLASFTFNVPLAAAMATSVLVGNAIGRGDSAGARRAAGAGLACGTLFMATTAALFLVLPGLFATGFTDDAAVVAVAVSLVPIAGVFQVFDGVQVVASGILRGAGESRVPAAANLVGYWLVGLPVGWWLTTRTSLGPRGVWWGLTGGLVAVAALLSWRVVHVLGRDLARLDVETPAPAAR